MHFDVEQFAILIYWIRERESIRCQKESGAPRPWTYEMRFAISTKDGRYLTTTDVPFQWSTHIDAARLWEHRVDAKEWQDRLRAACWRCRVVQVREES